MTTSIPSTHPAVATVAIRAPLAILEVDTVPPAEGEVIVHVEWTASTPLNLHQADGGLLVTHPQVMGDGFAGTIVQLGPPSTDPATSEASKNLQVGDKVFGFAFQKLEHRSMQTYVTVPTYLLGKIPPSVPTQAAVTVPNNLVTAMHTITTDLGLELPWPLPDGWAPAESARNAPVLVWGAASSVGMYAVQVLRHWGYANVLAVASARHHAHLGAIGAAACFDYGRETVVEQILGRVSGGPPPRVPFVIDCIGSLGGTLAPLSRIAERGARVAVMLPVILSHASATEIPAYEMDVDKVLVGEWEDGVELRGVRTHFYTDNKFFKYHLQPEIVPALLEQGVIQPNKQRIVEGKTLLERAENALSLLRDRAPSGERLVWRVADE